MTVGCPYLILPDEGQQEQLLTENLQLNIGHCVILLYAVVSQLATNQSARGDSLQSRNSAIG